MDPRVGFEWRPHNNLAVRFSAGSSISPPYLLRDQPSERRDHRARARRPGRRCDRNHQCRKPASRDRLWIRPRRGLRPERWDDVRARRHLRNEPLRAVSQLDVHQRTVPDVGLRSRRTAGSQFVRQSFQRRYEGIELAVRRIPHGKGWGYDLSGSTQRGYAYNLPPNFIAASCRRRRSV